MNINLLLVKGAYKWLSSRLENPDPIFPNSGSLSAHEEKTLSDYPPHDIATALLIVVDMALQLKQTHYWTDNHIFRSFVQTETDDGQKIPDHLLRAAAQSISIRTDTVHFTPDELEEDNAKYGAAIAEFDRLLRLQIKGLLDEAKTHLEFLMLLEQTA
ncbi:MAG: hypothetical protein RLY57_710 [Candidatus Parcubacteria bacterium]|jgi:hypothetical protein